IETANAAIEVNNTKVLLNKSATKTIPNGASQLAAFIVSIPASYTLVKRLNANPSPIKLPAILNTRCVTVFLQNVNCNKAINKCTNTVAIMLLSIIYLLLQAYLNYLNHLYQLTRIHVLTIQYRMRLHQS